MRGRRGIEAGDENQSYRLTDAGELGVEVEQCELGVFRSDWTAWQSWCESSLRLQRT